jgi:putative phosphoribosyl transferase
LLGATEVQTQELSIHVAKADVRGTLAMPSQPAGLVVLVHGSGVTRRDPYVRELAQALEEGSLATLLTDLLEDYEAHDPKNVFDIELQASRLVEVMHWLASQPGMRGLPLGLLGTGVGTGVALAAAAKAPHAVNAVVCCGGRPDTASQWLPSVGAPTLFMSDGHAPQFTRLAYEQCAAPKELVGLPPGEAASRARDWLQAHLARNPPTSVPA